MILFDPAQAYSMVMQPQFIYPILAFVIGYGAWDRFIRRAFRIHVCMEEGEALREIKSFKVPVKKVGTVLKWTVIKRKGKETFEEGKAYIIDGADVLFTDRFNKMHIIQPYDETFGFHPFSDVKGKLGFTKLASAKAETLFQVVAKGGIVARTEALRQKLQPLKASTAIALVLVGTVIGISFGVSFLPHVYPALYPPTTTVATQTIANTTSISRQFITVTEITTLANTTFTSTITHTVVNSTGH